MRKLLFLRAKEPDFQRLGFRLARCRHDRGTAGFRSLWTNFDDGPKLGTIPVCDAGMWIRLGDSAGKDRAEPALYDASNQACRAMLGQLAADSRHVRPPANPEFYVAMIVTNAPIFILEGSAADLTTGAADGAACRAKQVDMLFYRHPFPELADGDPRGATSDPAEIRWQERFRFKETIWILNTTALQSMLNDSPVWNVVRAAHTLNF